MSAYRTCYCDQCRKCQATAAARRRYRLRAYGTYEPWVPAHGTRRRIQALYALGWTGELIAPLIGYREQRGVSALCYRKWVKPETYRAVCAAFEKLSATPGPSVVTRKRALAKGWLPPLAWDDPDDEFEVPSRGPRNMGELDETAICLMLDGYVEFHRLRYPERAEAIRRMRARGMSSGDIAAVTGLSPDAAAKARERAA